MDAPQRFAAHEAFERFNAESELAHRQGTLEAQPARTQTLQVFGCGVFWSVDDPQILRTATLHGRLHKAALAAHHEINRLDYHALTAARRAFLPPAHSLRDAALVAHLDELIRRGMQQSRGDSTQ